MNGTSLSPYTELNMISEIKTLSDHNERYEPYLKYEVEMLIMKTTQLQIPLSTMVSIQTKTHVLINVWSRFRKLRDRVTDINQGFGFSL